MDPATREKFKKFMDDHKYAVQLMRTTGGIGRLEREGLTPLTSAQAQSILAVLNPLRTKDALSEDDAKAAIKGVAFEAKEISVFRNLGIARKEITGDINPIEIMLGAKVAELKQIQSFAGVLRMGGQLFSE